MSAVNLPTLVLNNNFQPLSIFPLHTISAQDAIVRVVQETAYSIVDYPREVLTPSRHDLLWPSVIVNKNGFKYTDNVRLKKDTLFYRDRGRCQYCYENLIRPSMMTFDHVYPQSMGGKHEWTNVVACCAECNAKKANKLPVGEWKPKTKPIVPSYWMLLENRRDFPIIVADERWMQYLPDWRSEVIVKPQHISIHCE